MTPLRGVAISIVNNVNNRVMVKLVWRGRNVCFLTKIYPRFAGFLRRFAGWRLILGLKSIGNEPFFGYRFSEIFTKCRFSPANCPFFDANLPRFYSIWAFFGLILCKSGYFCCKSGVCFRQVSPLVGASCGAPSITPWALQSS